MQIHQLLLVENGSNLLHGRTLIGEGTNGDYTFTAESTGTTVDATTNPLGEYRHILSVEEMPRHKHNISNGQTNLYERNIYNGTGSAAALIPSNYNNGFESVGIDYSGGDEPHNNIQPYIVTYMWKRIK